MDGRKVFHVKTTPDASGPGRLVRSAREREGLTREELGRQAGVSTSTVARIELYDHLPSALALARVAARLKIPVNELLPGELRVPEVAAAP